MFQYITPIAVVAEAEKDTQFSFQKMAERRQICEECLTDTLVNNFREGTLVCSRCGLVNEERCIDQEAEWRNFADDSVAFSGPNRAGGCAFNPLAESGKKLVTRVGGNKNSALVRQNVWRAHDYQSRKLYKGYRKIDDLADSLNIKGETREKAKSLLKEVPHVHSSSLSTFCCIVSVQHFRSPPALPCVKR